MVLTITCSGRDIRVTGHEASFGRTGPIRPVPATRYMSRIVGRFFDADGEWWIRNEGSNGRLRLKGSNGWSVKLPAGERALLSDSAGVLDFTAGPHRYELGWFLGRSPGRPAVPMGEGATTDAYHLDLSGRERQAMAMFALPIFDGEDAALSYKEVAGRMLISEKTLQNYVQGVSEKLPVLLVDGRLIELKAMQDRVNFLIDMGAIRREHASGQEPDDL